MTPEKTWYSMGNPRELKEFWLLGSRERKAVEAALSGLDQWKIKGEEPKPMQVVITPENQFDLKSFANVLHKLGIDIASSLKSEPPTDNKTIVNFQPKPYEGMTTLGEDIKEAEEFFRNLRTKPH